MHDFMMEFTKIISITPDKEAANELKIKSFLFYRLLVRPPR